MKTRAIRMLLITAILFGFSLICLAPPASAAIVEHYGGSYGSWPGDGEWIPISSLNDIDDGVSTPEFDVVGDSINPAVYHFNNEFYKFFRIRVQWPDPVVAESTFGGTIGVYFDYDRDGTLDYATIWDSQGTPSANHGLELQIADVEGVTWALTQLLDEDGNSGQKFAPPDFALTGGDGYIRTVDGVSTTNFDVTTFVDFAINCTFLASQTNMRCTGQVWNIMTGSIAGKTDHFKIETDVAGGDPTDDRFWSDSVNAAIDLLSFTAQREEGGVGLYWTTGSEMECGAFTILRCSLSETECFLADHMELPGIIVPCQDNIFGDDYQTLDDTAVKGEAYSYYLREYETTGGVFEYGPVIIDSDQSVAKWGDDFDYGSYEDISGTDNHQSKPSDDDDAEISDDDDEDNVASSIETALENDEGGCGF